MVGLQLEEKVIFIETFILNLLARFPYRLPRPKNMDSARMLENGKTEPAIDLTFSIIHIYNCCLQHLPEFFIEQVKRNKRTNCNGMAAGKEVRIGFWVFKAVMTGISDLSVQDAEALFKSSDKIHEYFSLEIVDVQTLPPREKKHRDQPPLHQSKRQLTRDMTKSR